MGHDVFFSFSFEDQQIAEDIVNALLTKYGIKSWICTRNIGGGDYFKEEIPGAIDDSSAVVFLQSSSALLSKEIPKEIGLALEANKPIIPFRLDDTKPQGKLRYDLSGITYIDATKPEFEDRIRDLAVSICRLLGRQLENMPDVSAARDMGFFLRSHISDCSPFFYGREELMKELDNKMHEGRTVFLQGMGGVGKSEIAKQYAKAHLDSYDTIVFCRYQGSLASLIADDDTFYVNGMRRKIDLNGEQQSDVDYAREKLAEIKRHTDERTLLIVDNYDIIGDPFLTELTSGGRYRLLITTRCDQDRKKYCVLKVPEIASDDALKDIVLSNCSEEYLAIDRDDPAFTELFALVNRHTFTLELIAQYMEEHSVELGEMVALLRERGLAGLQNGTLIHDDQFGSCYGFIKALFFMESLNATEIQLLRELALMPEAGVRQSLFRNWCGQEIDCRTGLIKRSWIKFDSHSGLLSFHPIIYALVHEELKPSAENCAHFLEAFLSDIQENKSWNYPYEKKQEFASYCSSIENCLGTITKENYHLYFGMAVFLNFTDSLSNSKARWTVLQKSCEELFTLNGKEAAQLYQRIGFLYCFAGQYEEAISIYNGCGLALMRQHAADLPDEYVHMLCDCSNAHFFKFINSTDKQTALLDAACKCLDEAQNYLDICWKKDNQPELRELRQALVYNSRVKLCHELGDHEQELGLLEKAYDIFQKNPQSGALDLASVQRNLGKANIDRDIRKAIEYLQQAVSVYRQMISFSSSFLDTLLTLASCHTQVGEQHTAQIYLEEAYHLAKQMYVERHPTLQKIENLLAHGSN